MRSLVLLCVVGLSAAGNYDYPQTLPSQQTMVHLFEWKWTDVAAECENFLQYFGYGAVQISPPNEHINLVQDGDRPWWVRYQPVSYRLVSRSGNEAQFKDMVQRCNKVGVRIVVDAVINHMVGAGQSYGVGGVSDTDGSKFRGTSNAEYFPDVPFDNSNNFHDSHCGGCDSNCNIPQSAYTSNAWQVRMCRLSGLLDLDQSNEYVAGKIADYMNNLIDIGVAGFRVDATKHMWPADLTSMYAKLHHLRSDIFGDNAQPFIVGEVIDQGGEAVHGNEYTADTGRITNFRYGQDVKGGVGGVSFHITTSTASNTLSSRTGRTLVTLGRPGTRAGRITTSSTLSTTTTIRGEGLAGILLTEAQHDLPFQNTLTYKNGAQYTMAVTFMLAWNYGYPRVMSSYYFNAHNQGPPSSGSPNFFTKSPSFNTDYTCNSGSGWVCEHRWPAIRNMAYFRKNVYGTPVSGIVTQDKGIGFQRPGKGFFVANSGGTWSRTWDTGLPAGTYCDVISGGVSGSSCTGTTVTVGGDGKANFAVNYGTFAIHVGAMPGGGPTGMPTPTGGPGPTVPVPVGSQKTVIFLKLHTTPGQNLFIRGGLSGTSSRHCGTTAANNPCSIPIVHETTVPASFKTYTDWSKGDRFLDWYGAEAGQGTYKGQAAQGTPLAYSTNKQGDPAYQKYNTFGPDYWMVVLDVDCSKTANGWFELKGYQGSWESDISQGKCGGNYATGGTFSGGKNHYAQCGALNVFEYGQSGCTINKLPF